MAVHRSFSPFALLLGLLLAMAGGLVPTELLAARSDAPTLRGHTFDPVPRSRAKTRFESWDVTVHLDAEEAIEQHISFRYVVPAKRAGEAHRLSLAVVDGARGDLCEELDLGPSADATLVPESLTQEAWSGWGFDHFGRPELCSVQIPAGAGAWEGTLVVSRPPVPRLDHRFALLLPVQPLGAPADLVRVAVEYGPLQEPRIQALGWQLDLRRKEIADRRVRSFFELARVRALPLRPVSSLSGRVPALAITSGEDWETLAREHRAFFDTAARLKGPVLSLAGRVLGQTTPLDSLREAMRLALDEIELDASAGRGGGWQLPERASTTVESGKGTASDRAALLLALLRGAEIRAEVVLASSTAHRVSPSEPLAILNQTLIVLPDLELRSGSGPVFVDPSRSSAWLGALDESLLGRDALMLRRQGARWLRLPSELPRQQWTLNVKEAPVGRYQWTLEGLLDGAPAARVREWARGRDKGARMPAEDLAWLSLPGWSESPLQVQEMDGGRLAVTASGSAGLELLDEGRLPRPLLPVPAPSWDDSSWPYARDARRARVDLLESWVFDGLTSGTSVGDRKRTTPFWEGDILASWSGPVFNRRSRFVFSKDQLAGAAAVEVERFLRFIEEGLGGVSRP